MLLKVVYTRTHQKDGVSKDSELTALCCKNLELQRSLYQSVKANQAHQLGTIGLRISSCGFTQGHISLIFDPHGQKDIGMGFISSHFRTTSSPVFQVDQFCCVGTSPTASNTVPH